MGGKERGRGTSRPYEQTALQRQIEATDRQIDVLVYELYGLTEEEIGNENGIRNRNSFIWQDMSQYPSAMA